MIGWRALRWVLAVLAVLLLAGCAGLPTDGPVQTGRAVDSEDGRPGVVQQPEPPEPGASMEDVAEGFVRAHTGTAEGFDTARKYLSGPALHSWDPDQGILLLDSLNLSPSRQAGSQIRIKATAVAEVDEDGYLRELPNHQLRQLRLELTQVNGEWRITSVPGDLGTWMSVSDFQRSYRPRTVYRAAERGPTPSPLVPDVRWLPDGGLATALARAVIGPPPKWLTETARRPVPERTRLKPSSVSVSPETRTATVTLSKDALEASPQDRKALWASMVQTLSQVPGVARVEIRVGNSLLQLTGVEGEPSVERLGFTVAAGPLGPVIVREGNRLEWKVALEGQQRSSGGDTSDLEDLPTMTSQWSRLAADTRGREIAAVSGDQTRIGRWIAGRLTTRPSFGTSLVRPAYDGQRRLWVAGRALSTTTTEDSGSGKDAGAKAKDETEGSPTIWTIDTRQPVAQAQAEPVSAPWLGNREVRAIAISPDAHRVALVVKNRRGSVSLLVSGVVRDKDGGIDSLGTPVEANPAVRAATSVTWTDETTLGVIGKTPTASTAQPILVPLGSLTEPLGPVAGAETVVGSALPQDRAFVITDRSSVQHRLGRAWNEFASADDLAAPAN